MSVQAFFCGKAGLLLVACPVLHRLEAGPGFVDSVGLAPVVVAVGGLLDRQIVPGIRRVVGPGDHAVQQIVRGLGQAAQHPVHQCHRLGPADAPVRGEAAVRLAFHPALHRRLVDVLRRPVAADVGEAVRAVIGRTVKAGRDGRELAPGDGCVGVKDRGGAALHDAHGLHGGHGGGVPFLDNQYTVYGEVVEGMDVVDAIQSSKTNKQDRPTENIVINSVEIL